MRITRSQFLAPVLMALVFAGCADQLQPDEDLASSESAICSDPDDCPPPHPHPSPGHQGPPFPTASATGKLELRVPRNFITQAFDQLIADFNAHHDGRLSWDGPKFNVCAGCKGSPERQNASIPAMNYFNHVKLHYSDTAVVIPIHRNIDVPLTMMAECVGWTESHPTGALTLRVYVDSIIGVQVTGGGWFEDFVDFFALGHLTSYIDGKVRAAFGQAQEQDIVLGSCSTVGAFNPAGTEQDAFVWDVP